VRTRIKDLLANYPKRRLPINGKRPAAVLVPLFEKEGEPFLLLTRRGTRVRDHQREISFPGGVFEEGDGDLRETALRECSEELGLDRSSIEILGEFDDESTFATGYRITPFLAWLSEPGRVQANTDEIDEVLRLPLARFQKPSRVEWGEDEGGERLRIPFYEIGPHEVWGATGRIIERMTALLREVTTPQAGYKTTRTDPRSNYKIK
jgi:8-oxo-dGTP pyrophosphatase MutT (NUDIX family)